MRALTLTRFDPEPPERPERWQVGYTAVLDDGVVVYPVTTVYASRLGGDTSRAAVLVAAENDVRPGLRALEQPRPAPADWFDSVVPPTREDA